MGTTAAFRMIIDIEVTDVSRFRQLAAEASAISLDEPGTNLTT
jgi:hypothetical protein